MTTLTKYGRVFVLEFLGAGDHRLTAGILDEMIGHLKVVEESDDAGALITTNKEGKFYNNGLDLDWIKEDPETRGPLIYRKLEEFLIGLMELSVPTIACLNGHAAGGGFPLSMAHDHRIMRGDRGFLYNSAVDIGVAIPAASLALCQCKMTPKVFKDAILKGTRYTGKMALEAGLVDAVYDDFEKTLQGAMKEAETLASKNYNRKVYKLTRGAMYPQVLDQLRAGEDNLFIVSKT